MTRAEFQQLQRGDYERGKSARKGPWRLFGQYWIEARQICRPWILLSGKDGLYHMAVTATTLWFRAQSRSSYLYGTLSVPKGRPWLESLRQQAFVLRLFRFTSSCVLECCFLIQRFFDLPISWFKDLIPAVGGRPAWMSMTTLFVPVFMHTPTTVFMHLLLFYPSNSFQHFHSHL